MQYVDGRSTVIQAGGNSGLYAKLYANHFENVYTFEPDSKWFQCLTHNANADNIFKFQCCLGNDQDGLAISPPPDTWGGDKNLGAIRVVGGGNIPQLKIDSLNLRPDLIHLDIEGYEQAAIQGALATIEKYKPVIVIESNDFLNKFYGHCEHDAFKLIEPFGYKKVMEWVENNQNAGTQYQTSDILYSVS
jgi:FkbM family methyltransferase